MVSSLVSQNRCPDPPMVTGQLDNGALIQSQCVTLNAIHKSVELLLN